MTKGEEVLRFTERKKLNLPKKQSISSNDTYRNFGWRANVNYEHSFDLHDVLAEAAFRYTTEEKTGNTQDVKNGTFTFRGNYAYNKRYFVEGVLSAMGSNRFSGSNRYFFAYAIGGGHG